MTTQVHRIYNFSAGPATMPLPVLEQIQRDLLALPGVGMSVLEISHRSKPFQAIIDEAVADARELAGIPENYKILFLQGGASTQFSMVPMNLHTTGMPADYIVTGAWGKKAVKEAKRVGEVNVAATTEADNYSRLPRPEELKLTRESEGHYRYEAKLRSGDAAELLLWTGQLQFDKEGLIDYFTLKQ